MLTIDAVSVDHGGEAAVVDASLTVDRGESVAVVGSNGAGKTTLLRAICGFAPVRSGEVQYDGEDIAGGPAHQIARRGVAFVPAERHLFADMTVRENLAIGAHARRAGRRYLAARSDPARAGRRPLHRRRAAASAEARVLELFPRLAERSGQLAGSLSGGEQQMLAIGRALMAQPRLLVLDEPTSGLAPRLARQAYAALHELRRDGLTMLIAEQQLHLVLGFADRGYVMASGAVTAQAAAHELHEHPAVRAAYPGA